MKGRGGFTLIEILVVIAIIVIVAAIGFSMDGWENRTAAESQVKQVYADLMNARETAITQKRWVFVIFAANNGIYGYKIYLDTFPAPDGNGAYDSATPPNGDAPDGPNWTLNGAVAMYVNGAQNPFTLSISPDGSLGPAAGTLYMKSATPPQLNCIDWTATDISLGGWSGAFPGGSCVSN